MLPVQIEAFGAVAKTSLLIPPLLALTYCLLGVVFPPIIEKVVGDRRLQAVAPSSVGIRAVLAVVSTAVIIRSSAMLTVAGVPPVQVKLV